MNSLDRPVWGGFFIAGIFFGGAERFGSASCAAVQLFFPFRTIRMLPIYNKSIPT
jgi:hypothetical protein